MMTSTSKAEVGCVVDVRHIDSIDRGWIIFKVDYWKKYMNGMRNFCYIEINSFVLLNLSLLIVTYGKIRSF